MAQQAGPIDDAALRKAASSEQWLTFGLDQSETRFSPLADINASNVKELGLEAVEIVRERVERFQIPCDLTWGYCDLANKPRDLQGLAEDAEALRSLGYRQEVRLLQASEMGSVIGSSRSRWPRNCVTTRELPSLAEWIESRPGPIQLKGRKSVNCRLRSRPMAMITRSLSCLAQA